VALATVGLLLVTARTPPDFVHARRGDLLELSTVFTWTAFSLLAARPLRRSGALRVNALAMGVAAAATLGVGLWWPGSILPGALDARVLGAWAFLAVLCSAGAMWLWLGALAVDGQARTAAMLYLEPFFTLGVSVWLLDEPVLPVAFLGGTLVLVGVWLVGRGTRLG
jgi:drug/metabolite transporter (DMT)-like permease